VSAWPPLYGRFVLTAVLIPVASRRILALWRTVYLSAQPTKGERGLARYLRRSNEMSPNKQRNVEKAGGEQTAGLTSPLNAGRPCSPVAVAELGRWPWAMSTRRAFVAAALLGAVLGFGAIRASADQELLRVWSAPGIAVRC